MLLALASACGPHLAGEVTVEPSALVPTAVVARFRARGGDVRVRIERSGWPDRLVEATVDGDVATARIVGLAAGERYRLVGVVDGVDRADVRYRAADPPDALDLRLRDADPDADLSKGYLLASLESDANFSGVVAVDGEGEPVWWVASDRGWRAQAPRLTLDGQGVLFLEDDEDMEQLEQRLVRVELDGSARTDRQLLAGHHMVAELDGGEFVWPSWDIRQVPWDHGAVSPVLGDKILVGDGEGEPRTLMSFFDDRGPAYVECSHGLEPDERLGQTIYEWTHTNAVVWEPDRDVLVVNARLIDSVLELDRRTGEVRWQLGGRDGTLALDDPSSHGHLSDAWDGGLLLFDNGSHHQPRESRVVEYAIDEDRGEARVAWQYHDPDVPFVPYLGDARRLPSDDVLIAWGPRSRVDEVTRRGELRWSLDVPDATVGRVRYLERIQP